MLLFTLDTALFETQRGPVRSTDILSYHVTHIDRSLSQKIERSFSSMDFKIQFNLSEAQRRLDSGDYFVVLEKDARIIGWIWAGVGLVFFDEFRAKLKIKEDEAFVYNAYVNAEFRGLGLFNMLMTHLVSSLRHDNYKRLWAFIYSWNKASIRAFGKSDWTNHGAYHFLRLGFLKFGRLRGKRFAPIGFFGSCSPFNSIDVISSL